MRLARLILLAPLIASCTVWRTNAGSAADVIARREPIVRVNRRTILFDPAINGDSLVGIMSHRRERRELGRVAPDARVAVALADVHLVEVRRISRWRTTALVAGAAVVALAIAFVASDPYGDIFGPGSGPIITLTVPVGIPR